MGLEKNLAQLTTDILKPVDNLIIKPIDATLNNLSKKLGTDGNTGNSNATATPAAAAPAAPVSQAGTQAANNPIDVTTAQAAKTALAGAGQAGGAAGNAQTFLTGPGGIDPNALTLSKRTLLGGG